MSFTLEPGVAKGVFIRYKGIIDFQATWKLVADWFESKGYEVLERKAKHRIAPMGEELECAMDAWRNATDYYRFRMTAYVKYFDGQYVDVVKNGKKKKLLKARVVFKISGDLVLDYSHRYDKSKFTVALRKFMDFYVLRWQWDNIYGDQLNYKVMELQNVIKENLNFEAHGSEFADMW